MSFFDPVDLVLSQYHAAHDLKKVEISVDKLRPIFEQNGYVDRIYWEKINLETQFILAQIKTYDIPSSLYGNHDTYARIQYSRALNYCWTRFVLCKEMYHCMIDRPEANRTRNTDDLILLSDHLTNSFLEVLADEQEDTDTFLPMDTEKSAEIMALETLFPIELRTHHCEAYDKELITDYQLALRYKIPQNYIQLAMSSAYFSAVARGRNQVDIQL